MIKHARFAFLMFAIALASCLLDVSAGEAPAPAAVPHPRPQRPTRPHATCCPPRRAYQTIHNDFFWTDQNGNRIATRSGCICQFGKDSTGTAEAPRATIRPATSPPTWSTGPTRAWCSARKLMPTAWTCSTTTRPGNTSCFSSTTEMPLFLGIATADKPEGPFTFQSQTLVDGDKIGDTSMFKDTDGKAYLCYVWDKAGPNRQHGIYLMSPDYLTLDKRIYLFDIRSREAPMIMKRNNIYYYLTSRTAGIRSTATNYYTATNLAGPWSPPQVLSTPARTIPGIPSAILSSPSRAPRAPPTCIAATAGFIPKRARATTPGSPSNSTATRPSSIITRIGPQPDHRHLAQIRSARNLALNKTATASSATASNGAANVTVATTYQDYINYRWEKRRQRPAVDHGGPRLSPAHQPRYPQVACQCRQGIQDTGLPSMPPPGPTCSPRPWARPIP